MAEARSAVEVLKNLLDAASVPLIRRRYGCSEQDLAFAEVSGDDGTSAKILVVLSDSIVRVQIYAAGSEFVGVAISDSSTSDIGVNEVVDQAADFIRRQVYWELVRIDVDGIVDDLEDDIVELVHS